MKVRHVTAVLAGALALLASGSPAVFEEVSGNSGVSFKHEQSPTSNKYLVETMGGGVGLLDYDKDGRLDIFFYERSAALGSHARERGPG